MLEGTRLQVVKDVSRLLHAEKLRDAAELFGDFAELGLKFESDDPKICYPVLQTLFHFLMDNKEPELASGLLWKPSQFTTEPASVKALWKLFDTVSMGLIISGASLGKSFSLGARLLLEYNRDPQYTSIKLVGPTEQHLEENLFSHIVALHQAAALPMAGTVGDLYLGLDRRNRFSAITGLVIPVGQQKKSGRLQGIKRRPRPEIHPIHGSLLRLFIFLDELERVPTGVYQDIDNLISNFSEDDVNGLKILGAYNPTDPSHEVAKRAEPEGGWESFDIDKDYKWKSKRGWDVLRLDGERCENVIHDKIIYPGLQTKAGLERIARNAGGIKSAGYFSQGRGAYPPQGTIEMNVFAPGILGKMVGEFIWLGDPQPCGGCDLALEGGASAIFTLGKWGSATGVKFPPSLEFPQGKTVMFKNPRGQVVPRFGLQAEQQFILPKAATVAMHDKIIDVCRKAKIKPEWLALDRTGNGAGVCDLIRHSWGSGIQDLNFSEGGSDGKIFIEDTKSCKESYDRVASELWFCMRQYGEFGFLMLHPQLSLEKLSPQLLQRRYSTVNKRSKVESKRDFGSRGSWASPDEADSLSLLVWAARKGSGITLSMAGADSTSQEDLDDSWDDGKAHIDSSNRTDYLPLEA